MSLASTGSQNIVVIIQARMASSRLPGKVLLDIAGQPMLGQVVERARRASRIQQVIVATTTNPEDEAVEAFCQKAGYACYRGSMHDVLDRFYQAARSTLAESVVRITADCPLLDPAVVDATLEAFFSQPGIDFAANRLPPPWKRTFPIGLDVEVVSFSALQRAWKEASQPHQREHVMPYFYEEVAFSPTPAACGAFYVDYGLTGRGFRLALLNHRPDYGSLRWTVDTAADLELVRQIFARLKGRVDFTWYDVLALIEREPELERINADVKHKTAFDVDHRA